MEVFPSPVGVLHVSMRLKKQKRVFVALFPSPVGVLHVSIKELTAKEKLMLVSVPCRGLTCFYPAFCNALISRLTQCICG